MQRQKSDSDGNLAACPAPKRCVFSAPQRSATCISSDAVVRVYPQLLLALSLAGGATAADRMVESVLPALAYGGSCTSSIILQNLGDQPVTVQMEGHRGSGALVAVDGLAGQTVHLNPGQRATYALDIDEITTTAWVKLRETIPAARPSPAVALSGTTECRVDGAARLAGREVAYPTRNPWFSGDTADLHGASVTLINTSDRAARASACYSAGNLFFVPGAQATAQLVPICSEVSDVQIPPFGTREFPVERGNSSHFVLHTTGEAIVLQMLRPGEQGIFLVDSSIRFGEEVPESRRRSQ